LLRILLVALPWLTGCVGNTSGEARLTSALAGRSVTYAPPPATRADAMWQEWSADGTTVTGGPSFLQHKRGRWTAEGGRYCEIFGVSTEWTCWRITIANGGRSARFWEIPSDIGDLLVFHRDMTGWFAD